MAEKYQSDDSDDFFDMHASAKEGAGYGRDEGDKLSDDLELDMPEKGASLRDKHRSNSHSDQGASRGYSSDSATDSEIEIKNKTHDRAKLQSRSSSRSGGSYSSDDSYSSAERRSRLQSKQSRENHSRSRSFSGSRSRSRSPDSTAYVGVSQESKTRCRYRSTSSDRVSDSDGKNTGRLSGSSESDDNGFRQAWKVEVKHHSERRHRSQNDEHSPTLERPPRGRNSKHKRVRNKDRDSDSDITDVSPIPSPRTDSPESKKSSANPKSKILKGVDKPSKRVTDSGDIDSLDLNILLKAVNEMEKQNRIKANTRKVMFEPQGAKRMEKANYTFSNDDTRRIDQENQRLLHKIMHRMHQEDPKRPQGGRPKLKQPTPSAVNRRRDHQKIENENLAFLKRLNSIKPSRGISRQEQLSAYNTTMLHGVPVADLHSTTSQVKQRQRSKSAASSEAGSLGRTRSLTSISSATTASSLRSTATSCQSRRTGSRPCSAKKSVKERPPWDDRW